MHLRQGTLERGRKTLLEIDRRAVRKGGDVRRDVRDASPPGGTLPSRIGPHVCRPLRALVLTLAGLVLITGSASASESSTNQALRFAAPQGHDGAVASGESQATEVGLAILRAGGNAADAAVATALALVVTFPEAGNLGGGGFAVVKFGDEVAALDFRETAPAAATDTMYLDEQGEPIPDASIIGPLAAGVPGSPTGLYALHQRFGKLAWAEVVEPARRLAADGFRMPQTTHASLVDERDALERFEETREAWFSGGEPLPAGERLQRPHLAKTLAAYAEEGPKVFASGPIADAIVAGSSRHGGILTLADLAGYTPAWRRPLRFSAFGYEFAAMGLPSSGGAIAGQVLQVLERMGWHELGSDSTERDHLLVEAWRHVYADRFLLGDPETTDKPAETLISDSWVATRTSALNRERAGDSSELLPQKVATPAEPQDTTHLSVVDRDGNLVALTTTLNGGFGCGLWISEVGIFLNNEMDDFNTAPGRPNLYGLVQGQANLVRPGRRMLSSMSPTIGWNDEKAIAVGGRGGSRIPTATLQVLLGWIEGMPIQSAVDRERIHHQWLPDRIDVEPGARTNAEIRRLEALGHTVEVSHRSARVHAVTHRRDGWVEAAADRRGPGSAGIVRARP